MTLSYQGFVLIMFAGSFITGALATWKLFDRKAFSWFAVPLPFLTAVSILGGQYVYTVIVWSQN